MRVNPLDETLWMHTGDEVVMDEHVECRISARIKDTSIRGGENIYHVDDRRPSKSPPTILCRVVGVDEARYGQVAAAFLRPDLQRAVFR